MDIGVCCRMFGFRVRHPEDGREYDWNILVICNMK